MKRQLPIAVFAAALVLALSGCAPALTPAEQKAKLNGKLMTVSDITTGGWTEVASSSGNTSTDRSKGQGACAGDFSEFAPSDPISSNAATLSRNEWLRTGCG